MPDEVGGLGPRRVREAEADAEKAPRHDAAAVEGRSVSVRSTTAPASSTYRDAGSPTRLPHAPTVCPSLATVCHGVGAGFRLSTVAWPSAWRAGEERPDLPGPAGEHEFRGDDGARYR